MCRVLGQVLWRTVRAVESRQVSGLPAGASSRTTTPTASTSWIGERATDKVCSALQAVKCRQGKCQGFLLEQRPNNITDGLHWVCTACARTVPSHPPSGSSSLRLCAADTSIVYPAALQDKLKRLWNEAVANSNQKVGHSLRMRSRWIVCQA